MRLVRSGGFSLLELLVVVMIIGLIAGAAVLSMGVVGTDREIEREVIRLRTLLDLLREEAIMQSRDFAVLFAEDGYRFYIYDYQQLQWVDPVGDELLAARQLGEPIRLDLRVEDRDLVLEPEVAAVMSGADEEEEEEEEEEDDGPEPQIMILSSGEMTPFEASFYRDLADGRFILTAELDGSFEVSEDGFDSP